MNSSVVKNIMLFLTVVKGFQFTTFHLSHNNNNIRRCISVSVPFNNCCFKNRGNDSAVCLNLNQNRMMKSNSCMSRSMVIDSQSTRTLTKVRDDLDTSWNHQNGGLLRNTRISLTKEERDLFELLTNVAERYNSETVLRVAGGWVRDKLLADQHFMVRDDNKKVPERLTSKRRQKSVNVVDDMEQVEYDNTLSSSTNTSMSSGKQNSSSSEIKRSFSESALVTSAKPVDIDIAINNMLGREFAELVNEYLSERGQEIHKVGVVLTNPEMSKHLETATLSIGNFWIDFVNLRTEVYKEDDNACDDKGTRVPVSIGIGTPQEDAFRRDLTINALFYNLQEEIVEDFTGSGLADLRAKIVRTPIDPVKTFLDDPLRVLRSIRFASRLDFLLDQDLKDAVRLDDIRTSLVRKVSRERVGSEIDLMLRSSRPVRAAKLLYELNLMASIFPLKMINGRLDIDYHKRGVQLLATTHSYLSCNVKKPPGWCKCKSHASNNDDTALINDEETRRLLWYACLFHPYMIDHINTDIESNNINETDNKKKQRKGKKSTQSPIYSLLVDELKRPLRDAQGIETIQQCARMFSDLVMNEGGWDSVSVLVSGVKILPDDVRVISDEDLKADPLLYNAMTFRLKCARILSKCKNLWRAALVLSLCYELHACIDSVVDVKSTMAHVDNMNDNSNDQKIDIISQYNAFGLSIMQLNLIGIWNMKPLIDGDELTKSVLVNLPRGPLFRDVLDLQWEYMVQHPGCNAEMVKQYLQNEFERYV